MERKASSEIGDHAQRAAQAAKELAKSAGKAGIELAKAGGRAGLDVAARGGKAGLKAGIAGGKMAAKYVNEHPKRTAIGMAVAVAVTQEGHEWKENESFVEQSVEARTLNDAWLVDVRKVASVTVDESHGTLYVLFKMILKDDPAFADATADQRAHVIDAMIAASRELNSQYDLDNFASIQGERLVLPTEFVWRPRESGILKKPDGYETLQEYAQTDGFDMDKPHQEIYQGAKPTTVNAPLEGEGFVVDREGSEDSEPRLVADVIGSIEHLGQTFGTLELGDDGKEWKFVVTDMLRDAQTQARRGSISQGSTHATGRSFDVSDGRFVTPDGEVITWSQFDEHGRAKGRGPNADVIDGVLRPAFEELALESGWLLYKEPGHWHVYVPKELDVDLSEEWEKYVRRSASEPRREKKGDVERGEISQKIGDRLLEDYGQSVRRRASFAELEPERDAVRLALRGDTFIHELKTHGPNYDRIVDQIMRAQAQDLGRLGYFEHTTIHHGDHPMSDIEAAWRWKTRHKLTEKRFGEYVEARVGTKNHGYDFESWYRDMRTLHEDLQEHAEALAAHNGGLTSGEAQSLIEAITPEVMLATIHAELISELPGPAFIDVAPRLFDGYNIMQGPALHDFQFSSGPAQLIFPTFKLMLAQYGAALRTVQTNEQDFGSVIIPKKEGAQYRTKDIADAMVLDQESATFWSYLSLIYHTEAAFHTLMQNRAFARSWEGAREGDRLRFMATFAPVANHVGRGGAVNEANELLSKHGGKSLHDLAYAVQELRMKTSAVRSARVGLECMEEMIARAK